jgi:uncharacterized membrane protein YhaH (DUF805 family)
MQNRTTFVIGIGLVTLGVIAIFNTLFQINLWSILLPLLLIGLGVFIVFRPKTLDANTNLVFKPLGDIDYSGNWLVSPQEIWFIVGDAELDFSQAVIPDGITHIKLISFVGDVRIRESQSAGLQVSSKAFVTDSKVHGHKQDYFLSPLKYTSPQFENQSKKIVIDSWFFVGEIRVDS